MSEMVNFTGYQLKRRTLLSIFVIFDIHEKSTFCETKKPKRCNVAKIGARMHFTEKLFGG